MRKLTLGFVFVLLFCASASAALVFPQLTGRIVDDAHILSADQIAGLDQKLENYERGTTNQVVVATINSLQGDTIEDYGYQLGRQWQIGQKDKNNGIILIVAPNERKVRIEVGYGLEGVLTDALSSEIIQGIILPQFRAGDIPQGVASGTQAILDVLGGKSLPRPAYGAANTHSSNMTWLALFVVIMVFRIFLFNSGLTRNHPWLGFLTLLTLSSRSGGYGSGSGFGGGFSGGGGSFGGGGASGSW
jgi:uncharacterized protein